MRIQDILDQKRADLAEALEKLQAALVRGDEARAKEYQNRVNMYSHIVREIEKKYGGRGE